VAFEKRIAAAIADPGVVDVSTSWTVSSPPPLLALLKGGRKTEFDSFMAKASSPTAKAKLNSRMRPFGFSSYLDTYKAVSEYHLRGITDLITCPLFDYLSGKDRFNLQEYVVFLYTRRGYHRRVIK
jgi:hypothetical protein